MAPERRTAAVVLAAGLGTRMRSSLAKVLHRLGGRPLITYPLQALRSIGAEPIVVVVGHQADAVRAVCEPFKTRFALQPEQKGTGHAVAMAEPALDGFSGDVLLVYGDLPFLSAHTFQRLVEVHRQTQATVSLLTETLDDPASFGRILRDRSGAVTGIVEDRDCTPEQRAIREVNVGVYCADAHFLFDALRRVRPDNAQREIYLTDIIAIAQQDGARIAAAGAASGEGAQISDRIDLAAREKTLRERIAHHWMAEGVTLEDPATAYIGPDVTIGRDTVIGPNVTLRGHTRIGEHCRFEGNASVTDSRIGNRAHVRFDVVINEADLGDDVSIGPFAHLRPGTRLGERVHIGNFVETKNAALGDGTKASHLSYLGDAEIGAETNVGAGTITCNYDGFVKSKTVIGARVMVGSDSQLIAPVQIGDDAYIATGTTVRKDVPAGSLVFNPRPQMERPGLVAGKRKRNTEDPK